MFADAESEATFASGSDAGVRASPRAGTKIDFTSAPVRRICERIERYFHEASRGIVYDLRLLIENMFESLFNQDLVDAFVEDLRAAVAAEIRIPVGNRIQSAFVGACLDPPRPIFVETFSNARRFCEENVEGPTLTLVGLRSEVVALKTKMKRMKELREPIVLELAQLHALRKATGMTWEAVVAEKHALELKKREATERLSEIDAASKDLREQIERVTKQRASIGSSVKPEESATAEVYARVANTVRMFQTKKFVEALKEEREKVDKLRQEFISAIGSVARETSVIASRTEVNHIDIQRSRIRPTRPPPRTRKKKDQQSFKDLLSSVTLEQEEDLANAITFLSDVKTSERETSIRTSRRRDKSLCPANPYPLFHY